MSDGTLSRADAERAVAAARSTGQPVRTVLERLGLLKQKDWAQAAAEECGLPLAGIGDFPPRLPRDRRLSDDYLRRNAIAPVELDENVARFAVADPFDDASISALRLLYGERLKLSVATDRDVEAAMARSAEADAADQADAEGEAGPVLPREGEIGLDADQLTDLANNAPTVKYLDALFAAATEFRATDIHLEQLSDGPQVRLRIDGDLVEVDPPDGTYYPGVMSRLKILAGMDISERRLPQDGRIRQRIAGREVDMRAASTPTIHGEALVLRLLDSSGDLARLEDLDMPGDVHGTFREALGQPNGLILVTGPTGSGKTTTLHAALNELNETRRKIVTIENPVEIQTPGLQQIEVNPDLGWTFSAALRTVLRHDPDVLMVGEIRDAETAELAVRAAMTGHLVFSTLHTNRAAEAVLRMVDMGTPDYLLRSVLRMSAGQRLVRRLCPDCAEPVDVYGDDRTRQLYEHLQQVDPSLGPLEDWDVMRSVGCDLCFGTGYRGRMAVFEALNAAQVAHAMDGGESGARTMGMQALWHVAEGQTSLAEVSRVFGTGAFWR